MVRREGTKVWDIGVRGFHWLLALSFFIAYFTGDDNLAHIYAGYVVGCLILFRLIWGFIGTPHAQFSDFVYSPREVAGYLRSVLAGQPKHYAGHNPLGGWMVVALLVTLTMTTWSGLEAYAAEGHGPLAGAGIEFVAAAKADSDEEHENEDEEGDEFWEEIHEWFANFNLLLVGLHIAGVLIASALEGENLVRAMITGYKR